MVGLHVRIFTLVCLLFGALADCPTTTGYVNWSSNSAWNVAGASVNIAAGQKVLLDKSPGVILGVIKVQGVLQFKDVNMELKTGGIVVLSGGNLTVGTPSCPIMSKVTITLYGNRSDNHLNSLGDDPKVPWFGRVALGCKGIAVADGGSLRMNGYTSGPLWTRIVATAFNGSNTLRLEVPVNWAVGDSIAIASTDFSEVLDAKVKTNPSIMSGVAFPEQSESAVISSISADKKTIQLKSPLAWMHWGTGYERAEVGLLTRRIIVQGDDHSDEDLYGGQVIMRHGPATQIAGVEFTRMGQQNIMGRYPVHWHIALDTYGTDASISDCSLHHNYQRCITVHETNGVMVKNNVAYHTYGHCYFLEDGAEINNVFDGNLGIYTKPMIPPLIPSDSTPTVFWIAHPTNTFINNAASSTYVAYWYAFPDMPLNIGVTLWGNDSSMTPTNKPIIKFDNNVAHSCYRDGFQSELHQNPAGVMIDNSGWVPSKMINETQYFSRMISYKCRRSAMWGKFIPSGVFRDCILLDAGEQLIQATTGITNTIFVGESDNYGLITQPAYGRSNPQPDGKFSYVGGYRTYDNGQQNFLINCTFVNFTTQATHVMGAMINSNTGQFGTYPDCVCFNCTFVNAVPMLASLLLTTGQYNTSSNSLCYVDGNNAVIPGGGYFAGNQTFYATIGGIAKPGSNGYFVPAFHGKMMALHVVPNVYSKASTNPIAAADQKIYRESYGTTSSTRYRTLGSDPNGPYIFGVTKSTAPSLNYYSVLATNSAGRRLAMGPYLDLAIMDHQFGDWAVVAVPLPRGTNYNITWGQDVKMTSAAKWEDLSPYASWYNNTNQHLYILLAIDAYTFTGYLFQNSSYEGYLTNNRFTQYFQLRSDCDSNCAVGDTYVVPPMPSTIPYVLRYDKYRANLTPPSGQSTTKSQMFAQLYPSHSVGGPVLAMTAWHTAIGGYKDLYITLEHKSSGAQLADNIAGQSAYQWFIRISRELWQAAVDGNVRVSVRRVSDAQQLLTGLLLLEDNSQAYMPLPSPFSCTPSYGVQNVYNGAFTNTSALNKAFSYANSTGICGGNTLALESGAQINLNKSKAYVVPSQYTHIEFYIRTTSPFINYNYYNISMVAISSGVTYQVNLNLSYVADFVINTNTWAFVRVPLSALGGVRNYTHFQFSFRQWWAANVLLVDQLRFAAAQPLGYPSLERTRLKRTVGVENPAAENPADTKSSAGQTGQTTEPPTAQNNEVAALVSSASVLAIGFVSVLALCF